jgi:hypothetical protein
MKVSFYVIIYSRDRRPCGKLLNFHSENDSDSDRFAQVKAGWNYMISKISKVTQFRLGNLNATNFFNYIDFSNYIDIAIPHR